MARCWLWWRRIHGGEDAVNAICDHKDIKAISFVGSTHVGTHVYNRASLNGKRVQCMMGAKNHAIVLPDAEGDVFRGLEVVEHASAIGNLQLGELANNVAGGVDTYTLLQPLGVCAGITPFNFPP